ncbi:MAG TPA: Ig-like domain repeat protein [Acidobacteriaceae bacterium]
MSLPHLSSLPVSRTSVSQITPKSRFFPMLSSPVLRRFFALAALAALALPAARAQNSFPSTAVGSSAAAQPVTVTVAAAGTVQSIAYLTLGAANLDYASAGSGDTCTGNSFSAKQTCSVSVVFSPKYPGSRNGAVVLLDGSGTALGTAYLSGVGQGSMPVLVPGTVGIAAGEVGQWTLLGDGGPATSANLDLPAGVAVDGAGNVFIADSYNNRVREVLAVAQGGYAAGDIITVAGDGDPGYNGAGPVTADKSPLNIPSSVAIDGAGNIYIADTNNNVVREVNVALNAMVTVAGTNAPGYSGDGGAATAAELNAPKGISVDAAGNLYIADTGNNVIRKVSGGKIATVVGTGAPGATGDGGAATSATLDAPYAVAFDSTGNLYIPDSGNNRIRIVTGTTINTFAGTGTAGYTGDGGLATAAELDTPFGVACDPASNVYIADARNYEIRKVSAVSKKISTVGGSYLAPSYIDGKADQTYGNGQTGENYTGNGTATDGGIYAPYSLAIDSAGNIYVAEYFDHIVREIVADQATLFFSPQYWVNQVSPALNQTIENDGNAGLTFSAIDNDTNSELGPSTSCSTTSGSPVPRDGTCLIGAKFAPTVSGNPVVGNITVTTNSGGPALGIALVGQSLALNQPSVALTAAPNPASFGANVTFAVTVTPGTGATGGTPTGTVSFMDTYTPAGGAANPPVAIGTPQTLAAGKATLVLNNLGVGSHVIVATYSGNTYYQGGNPNGNSNPVTEIINNTVSVALVNSTGNNPSVLGANVTFQATVTVTGTEPITNPVSFYNGTTLLGTVSPTAGVASFSTTTLPLGSNSITASYTDLEGDTATSKALVQMVEQQTTTVVTSSVNPSVFGSAVIFTATVTPNGTVAPTSTVTFYDGTTKIGTGTLAGAGVATFTTSTLTVGTHNISATYGGDTNDFSSTTATTLAQVVTNATSGTTLTASANPVIAGKSVVLTATVTETAGTAKPTGTVNFMNGTALLGTGTLNASGVATYTASGLAVGTYTLTAAYQGDANNSASTSASLSLSVVQATTQVALTASATAVTVSTPVMFTATITGNGGVPTGKVTFMDGTASLGTATLNAAGVATFTTSALPVGAQSITADYAGDANDAPGTSSAITINVGAFASVTELAASATNIGSSQTLSLLATVSSASATPPTGTLTFVSGSNTLGTATLANGSATLNVKLNAGSYTIVAKYGGDANNQPSTSNSVSVTVGQDTGFTMQLSPTSLTIPSSQYGVVNIDMKSAAGFTDTMALGCSSLPFSVTCSFSNNDVSLAANGSASVQLTVDTNSPLTSGGQAKNEMPGHGNGMLAAAVFPGSMLFGFVFWRFRKRHSVLKVLAIVAMLAGTTFLMNGCGGLSLNSAKAGTYTIQVTATGQKTGVTQVANLTVQVTQ